MRAEYLISLSYSYFIEIHGYPNICLMTLKIGPHFFFMNLHVQTLPNYNPSQSLSRLLGVNLPKYLMRVGLKEFILPAYIKLYSNINLHFEQDWFLIDPKLLKPKIISSKPFFFSFIKTQLNYPKQVSRSKKESISKISVLQVTG